VFERSQWTRVSKRIANPGRIRDLKRRLEEEAPHVSAGYTLNMLSRGGCAPQRRGALPDSALACIDGRPDPQTRREGGRGTTLLGEGAAWQN